MIHRLLLAVFVTLMGCGAAAQDKVYRLVQQGEAADINPALRKMDTVQTEAALRGLFEPVEGRHRVYLFMATFRGESYRGGERDFHDLIIVKTDARMRVLDAYQYTLEWAEMPLTSDLYRAAGRGVILKEGLSIEGLKFRKVNFMPGEERSLGEKGVFSFRRGS